MKARFLTPRGSKLSHFGQPFSPEPNSFVEHLCYHSFTQYKRRDTFMNADAIRHFYDYHFAENRNLWDTYITLLSDEQFTQPVNYSHGSVRNQIVHLMSVDDTWFSGMRGMDIPEPLNPDDFANRETIRVHWDGIEQTMRDYLTTLSNDMLVEKPFPEGEDENLILWQVLLHVVNHGTDHRAQLLRILHDLGVKTVSQDYIFYVYDHP
jgi:uncharacterized damage-inducible protein DinB